jgi:non-specific serine/threonine protein kinase
VRARHLDFHLGLAEQARPALFGPQQVPWLKRLDQELDNLLAAHAAADLVPEGAQRGLRLIYALRPYWINRGILGLGQQLTLEALQRPGAQQRDLTRCRGLFDAGQLYCFMGRYAEAQPFLEESLAIAREIDHKASIAAALQTLGMAAGATGALPKARACCEEAVALARELGNRRELAAALVALAQLHRVEGAADRAEPLYRDALAIARELGDAEVVAIGLLNLAMVSIDAGRGDAAREMLSEVLDIAVAIGSQPVGQSALEVCAGLCSMLGDWATSARLYGAAEAQAQRSGLGRDGADEAFLAPRIEASQRALGTEAFARAESDGAAWPYDRALSEARAWLEG